MKRTILHYAALLTLLGAVPHPTRAAGRPATEIPATREIAADSLQRLCGGRVPLYASGGGIWLEIPPCELRLAAQLDRGAGMRNRVLPSLPPFRIEAEPAAGVARLRIADTLGGAAFGTPTLPLARIAGTERLLAAIDECLYVSGVWYDCGAGILRNRRYGHESLLGVDTTACGTLIRIGVWYDVESPERSTEIQMPSGALPLEIGLFLTAHECDGEAAGSDSPESGKKARTGAEAPIEVVVGSTLPEEYAAVLRQAVERYNRHHRQRPLHPVPGGEVIPLTTPCGISYDASQERIAVHTLRTAEREMPARVRINLGAGNWEREALRHTLQQSVPYRTLRRLLTDAEFRRRHCLEAHFTQMLEEAFASPSEQPRPAATTAATAATAATTEATAATEKELARELRDIRRRMARWERFMREEARQLVGSDTEVPGAALCDAMLDEAQRLYTQMARQSQGRLLRDEVPEWIARGLIADAEGRFATPLLRNNGLTATPRETARRQTAVWKEVLTAATPAFPGGVPELFRRTLAEYGEAAFGMQESFLGELIRQLETHPELIPTAEALEKLYTQLDDGSGSATALFAGLERLRLEKIRTENQ